MLGTESRDPAIQQAQWLRNAAVCLAAVTASVMLTSCGASEEAGPGEDSAEPVSVEGTNPALREISAFAGTGSPKFKGDGGPALEAGFFAPTAVALDRQGNLYIAADNRIRRVNLGTGVIVSVAGTGRNGFSGAGGPAVEAVLAEPRGMVLDSEGNLLFAGNQSNRIRIIDAITGVITTVAGGGFGDRLRGDIGDGGPADSAWVRQPMDLAMDAQGNFLIVGDQRLRRVDARTGVITTIAGTGIRGVSGDGGPAASAALAEPEGVAIDGEGNIFIADAGNHRVRRIDGATGEMSTLAGIGELQPYGLNVQEMFRGGTGGGYSGDGGPASSAMLYLPNSVALDSRGNVLIADGDVRVRMVEAATGIITTVAAGEVSASTETGKIQVRTGAVGQIVSIALNSAGEMYLADFKMNVVHKVSAPNAP